MTAIPSQLQEAQGHVRRAIAAEIIDGNPRKALGLYVLANKIHLDVLRNIRASCSTYLTRLKDLRLYAPVKPKRGAESPFSQNKGPESCGNTSHEEDSDDELLRDDSRRTVCHIEGVVIRGRHRETCADLSIAVLVPKIISLALLDPMVQPTRSRPDDAKGRHIRKILVYGPSATGKTCLPQSLAERCINSTVYYVVTPLLLARCRQRGDTVLVKAIFDSAQKHVPSVICFDDLDALCSSPKSPRDEERLRSLKDAWLSHMSNVTGSNVLVVGVINNPWLLDDDVRAQFERILFVPLPQERERIKILTRLTDGVPSSLSRSDYKVLGKRTEGFTGTWLSMAVNDAIRTSRQLSSHYTKDKTGSSGVWRPCRSCSPGALPWRRVPAEEIPHLTLNDILASLEKVELRDTMSRRDSVSSKTDSTIAPA